MQVDVWTILAPLVVAVFGYVVTLARSWARAHTTTAQYALLANLTRSVVEGTEQALQTPAGTVDTSGSEKFAWAQVALVDGAKRLGITLSPAEVSALINAAVKSMKADDLFHRVNLRSAQSA